MQNGKDKLLSPKQPASALTEAYQIHQDLLKTIEVMDEKIDEVIKQHEAQFLLAYRNHIKNMKQQLNSIKQRSEQQQKKMLSNDRAVFLEKQLILFRQQALKLYDKLQQKTQECEHHKSTVKQFEKIKNIVQKENKDLLKENKSLQAQIIIQESRIKQQEQQLFQIKHEFELSKINLKQGAKGNTIQTALQYTDNVKNPFAIKPRQSFNFTAQSKKFTKNSSYKQDSIEKKVSLYRSSKKKSQQWMDHQLKNWFLQCIETIRKEVAQRKVYGYKSQDLNSISTWEQFRMIDKLRLLEMFMQNQKLLVWMYEKIFPSRMTELEEYFSAKSKNSFDNRQKSKSMNINIDNLSQSHKEKQSNQMLFQDVNNEYILPKVLPFSGKKISKKIYDVRQRIDIRNGKLNLSSINNQV